MEIHLPSFESSFCDEIKLTNQGKYMKIKQYTNKLQRMEDWYGDKG